jgi:hypothetical protein
VPCLRHDPTATRSGQCNVPVLQPHYSRCHLPAVRHWETQLNTPTRPVPLVPRAQGQTRSKLMMQPLTRGTASAMRVPSGTPQTHRAQVTRRCSHGTTGVHKRGMLHGTHIKWQERARHGRLAAPSLTHLTTHMVTTTTRQRYSTHSHPTLKLKSSSRVSLGSCLPILDGPNWEIRRPSASR